MPSDLALWLSIVETLCMWALVCWSWRKVTTYMSFARNDPAHPPTRLADGLSVCAIGAGAMEHGAYNVMSWFDPQFVVQTFGPLDTVMLTLLYVGAAWWICAPMIRRRGMA